jgi:hypothetical protein
MRSYHLCRLKRNREIFAGEILLMARRHGVNARRVPDPIYPNEIRIEIAIGHFEVSIELEQDTTISVFMANWYRDHGDTREGLPRYPENFGRVINGDLNDITFGKATGMHEMFEPFLADLDRGIARLKLVLAEAGMPIHREFEPLAA